MSILPNIIEYFVITFDMSLIIPNFKFIHNVILLKLQIHFTIYNYEYYYNSGFEIGLIPGGVLVTVYPVHK